jgi:hypothetical protein
VDHYQFGATPARDAVLDKGLREFFNLPLTPAQQAAEALLPPAAPRQIDPALRQAIDFAPASPVQQPANWADQLIQETVDHIQHGLTSPVVTSPVPSPKADPKWWESQTGLAQRFQGHLQDHTQSWLNRQVDFQQVVWPAKTPAIFNPEPGVKVLGLAPDDLDDLEGSTREFLEGLVKLGEFPAWVKQTFEAQNWYLGYLQSRYANAPLSGIYKLYDEARGWLWDRWHPRGPQ